MITRLTPEEDLVRRELAVIKGFPRWKRTLLTGGFLYYIHSFYTAAEVFRQFDGTWLAGKEWREMLRFTSLREALKYGEEMAQPSLRAYRKGQLDFYLSKHPAIYRCGKRVFHDAAEEEKKRRDGVVLQ
jgi:hypothetical protein